MMHGFENRFGHLMDGNGLSMPLYVAMMSNPMYKLNFMGLSKIPPNLLNALKDMLFNAVCAVYDNEEKFRANSNSNDGNANGLGEQGY